MTRSRGNPEYPLDTEIERTLLRERRLCKFTLYRPSSSTLDPNNPDKGYLTELSNDDSDREMADGTQENQQLENTNARPTDAINETEGVLDENGQVMGGQTLQTPTNTRNNQSIGRGAQERGHNPTTTRGAFQCQPVVQPFYYDPYNIIPPQPQNPLFAPIPHGLYDDPEGVQQYQQVQPIDPNARAIADFTRPVVQPYLRQQGMPRINANNFELKPALINMVQNNQFGGRPTDDPHAHLRMFLDYSWTCKMNGVPEDAIHLRLFPFSLRDRAKSWYDNLLPNKHNTW